MDGKLWLSGERAEDLDEEEDPNDEYFWTELKDWCRNDLRRVVVSERGWYEV